MLEHRKVQLRGRVEVECTGTPNTEADKASCQECFATRGT